MVKMFCKSTQQQLLEPKVVITFFNSSIFYIVKPLL